MTAIMFDFREHSVHEVVDKKIQCAIPIDFLKHCVYKFIDRKILKLEPTYNAAIAEKLLTKHAYSSILVLNS